MEKNKYEKSNIKLSKGKLVFVVLISLIVLSGVIYSIYAWYAKNNAKLNPTYASQQATIEPNQVWVATFQIAWNELMEQLKGDVVFADGPSTLANELNNGDFEYYDDLSYRDYYVTINELSLKTKNEIQQELQDRFGLESNMLNKINWDNPNGDKFIMYAALAKKFTFPVPFYEWEDSSFNNNATKVKYFGVTKLGGKKYKDTVEVLYYNNPNDCAINLKTNENEDVILYRVDTKESFDSIYKSLLEKTNKYEGNKTFGANDTLKIPEINLEGFINYDELCNRPIEVKPGIFWYIAQALQDVKFNLNSKGGNLKSEAGMTGGSMGHTDIKKVFSFEQPFVLFLKESDKQRPYFALKVDNADILVKSTENKN